eukprot:3787467-Alexandrium_andersonii.AAC.1
MREAGRREVGARPARKREEEGSGTQSGQRRAAEDGECRRSEHNEATERREKEHADARSKDA